MTDAQPADAERGPASGDAATRERLAQNRLQEELRARGMLREDGLTIYGQPARHAIPAGHEPEGRMEATALQRRLIACAHATLAPGSGLCASWVEQAFSRLGLGVVRGDAAQLYATCCKRTDLAELKVGMVLAVPTHPWAMAGRVHGHVGLYAGDRKVMDCVDARVRTVPLVLWLDTYGVMAEVHWGWLGNIPLS